MERNTSLEQKLAVSEWLQTILFAANKAESYENVIQQSLDKICVPMQFALGHAYFYNARHGQLESSPIWSFTQKTIYDTFIAQMPLPYVTPGKELPGKVLKTGKAMWVKNITQTDWFTRGKIAADLELKTAFAFPVFIEDNVSIVLEFFHMDSLDPDEILIEIAGILSTQLGYLLHKQKIILDLKKEIDAKSSAITHQTSSDFLHKEIATDIPEGRIITEDTDSKFEFHGKILVVEDVKANQFVLKRLLEKLGCTATIVNNGKESCDLLYKLKDQDQHPFDLIFMDCHMAVMDGFEATQIIRKMSQFGADVPIIALTSGLLEEDQERCLQTGMNDILKKPIRKQEIANILKRWKPDTGPSGISGN